MVIIPPKHINNPRNLKKAFLKWGDSIYGYIFLRIRNKETAEDVSQEVFFKAYRSRKTFNPKKSSLKTWLFTIAKNSIKDYFKNSNQTTTDINEFEDKIADKTTNLEEQTSNQNLIDTVLGKLKLLNERDQELIILRFKEDLSVKEIAKILSLEYSATKVAIHRAIKHLSDLCNPF